MDIKHITSDSLRRLLSLTEKKDQLIKAVTDVENEIVRVISGAATTVADVVESVSPGKAPKQGAKPAAAKPAKKKRTMSAAGRARISAATKARWAARRAK
jgi:hypothetical protein